MKERSDRGLVLIGVFKLIKVVALLALGVGALSLVHKDPAAVIALWLGHLRLDPDNHIINAALQRLTGVQPRQLDELGIGMLVYAVVFAVEGVGLLTRKRWAEWVTLIVTTSFLPVETLELLRRPTAPRVTALAINLAIVGYLIVHLVRRRGARRFESAQAPGSSMRLRPSQR